MICHWKYLYIVFFQNNRPKTLRVCSARPFIFFMAYTKVLLKKNKTNPIPIKSKTLSNHFCLGIKNTPKALPKQSLFFSETNSGSEFAPTIQL